MHCIPFLYKKLVTGCFWIVLVCFSPELRAQSDCWRLVWSDEFESDGAPDGKKWSYETGGGGWGNNEVQFYTATRNNSFVSNGTLKISARKSESGTWTSARLVTRGKAAWKYGRLEIRAKLPAGRGTWPAVWMMPQQSVYGSWPKSGEIDIMEHVGYEMNRVYGTVHTEAYNHSLGTQKGGNLLLTDVDKQFYSYTIEWSNARIKWLVNDKPMYAFYNENKTYKEWPFDQTFFLIMNIAIGGSWGGSKGIDPDLTEAMMEIDYVRVYTQEIAPPVISGPGYVTPGQQVVFSTPPVEGLNYRWILPGGVTAVDGTNSNTITVNWNDKAGQISVEAFNTCDTVAGAPIQVAIQLTSSPLLNPVPEEVTLFPIPARREVQITSAFLFSEVCLFSMTGKMLKKMGCVPDCRYVLQLHDVPAGVYLLSVTGQNRNTLTKKLIIKQ